MEEIRENVNVEEVHEDASVEAGVLYLKWAKELLKYYEGDLKKLSENTGKVMEEYVEYEYLKGCKLKNIYPWLGAQILSLAALFNNLRILIFKDVHQDMKEFCLALCLELLALNGIVAYRLFRNISLYKNSLKFLKEGSFLDKGMDRSEVQSIINKVHDEHVDLWRLLESLSRYLAYNSSKTVPSMLPTALSLQYPLDDKYVESVFNDFYLQFQSEFENETPYSLSSDLIKDSHASFSKKVLK